MWESEARVIFNFSFFIFNWSRFVADGRADHFFRRREARQHFADAVFAQSSHAHFAGAGAEHVRRHAVVNQFPRLVVHHENFKDAEAAAVAGAFAIVAAPAFLHVRVFHILAPDAKRTQFRIGRIVGGRALL